MTTNVCGIIAEYNPLHNGHVYHIAQAKKASGCAHLIVAMSGSCVQRGEIACYDKFIRAQWALQAGADMVLELPVDFALQSAQGFAAGGVRLLAHAGVTHLCFGSEIADIDLLETTCDALDNPSCIAALQRNLSEGMPYPVAQQQALRAHDPRAAQALQQPNFILGVQYLRAIRAYAPHIRSIAIERKGGGYNEPALTGAFSGASAIRSALNTGDLRGLREALPPAVVDYVQTHPHATMQSIENIILYKLRTLCLQELRELHGMGEGLEYLFVKGGNCPGLQDVLTLVKSKRYPMARIKRIVCNALLGSTKQHIQCANEIGAPYLRVLGFRRDAIALFERMTLPILTQKTQFDALQGIPQAMFAHDRLATNLQALAFDDPLRRTANRDYTQKVYTL